MIVRKAIFGVRVRRLPPSIYPIPLYAAIAGCVAMSLPMLGLLLSQTPLGMAAGAVLGIAAGTTVVACTSLAPYTFRPWVVEVLTHAGPIVVYEISTEADAQSVAAQIHDGIVPPKKS